ncbi:hypothetical protein QF035_010587 [Streptomyces umbrinus]|uniref:Uncharacterized protein n=1 Tax=Streptomyces umbrinus TaxID=67370 RepID=A0ABU0TB13_9ACTN|nr:hypothetical protein [Streptomyces umbrinus]
MGHVVLGSLATDEGDQRLRFVLGHFTQRAMARLKTSRPTFLLGSEPATRKIGGPGDPGYG